MGDGDEGGAHQARTAQPTDGAGTPPAPCSGGGGGGGGGGGRGADEGLLGVVLCRIKAHWVVKGDDGVEARFLWKDLVLSKEDPLFSLVPHAGRKKASTGE
jgi:hypothetical protein